LLRVYSGKGKFETFFFLLKETFAGKLWLGELETAIETQAHIISIN